ncbi:MAG: gliding motility-associated C-terminal domain-containing protein [Bacteroidota bacterium]
MKRILSILFLIVFFIIKNSNESVAQCSSIPAADICANAPDICDLTGYCGSTSGNYTSDIPTGITCTYSIENNSYIKFTAIASTVSMTVTVPSCSSSLSGVQIVILQTSNCTNFTTISNCGSVALGATQVITATGLTPGQVYYIMIDGNAGAICDYTISAATGVGTCCPVQANAGADVEICKGDNTTLTATGGSSYLWTPGNFTTPSITVSPSSTLRYTVAVSNDTCTVKDSVLVTVNSLPSVDAGIANQICNGDSLTLHPVVSSNLTLNSPLTFSNLIRYSIANLDTAFSPLQVSGINGTINSNSVASVCFDITHANDADLDVFLYCPDGTVLELSTDNGGTGDNYLNTCFTSSASQQIISSIAPFTGNYIPEGAGGLASFAGCSANGTWKLVVYDDLTGANIGSIENWSLTINNPVVDTTVTYAWSPTTGITGVTLKNPIVYPSTPIVYSLIATNAKGCSSMDLVNVIVNPLPLVNAGADTTICSGISFYLNGSGASTYSWQPSGSLNDGTLQHPLAAPAATTTYTLTGTSNSGCSVIDSVTITVNTTPDVNTGMDAGICNGDSVQLIATGGTTYTWSPATGLSNSSIANPNASPTESTTYIVRSTILGCIGSDTVTVTVGLISANAGNDTTICKGESIQMNASGGTSYNWLPVTGLSSSAISNPVASPIVTTTYTVTISSGQCSDAETITVFVDQPSMIQISNDTTLCFGNSVNLIASGGISYSWTPTEGLNNSLIANPVATPNYTNAYTVSAIDVNGCTSTETVIIDINPLPNVNAGNDVVICQGASVTLNVTGGNSFAWSPASSLSSAVISSPVASPPSTTDYIVTATSDGGCTDKDTVKVTVNSSSLAVVNTSSDVICFGGNTGSASVLASGGTGVYNYYWFPGAYTVSDVNNLSAGTYTVTVTDPNTSCVKTSIITIGQPADLIAAFNPSVTVAEAPATIYFTNNSIGATAYSWSFGDADVSTLTDPSHVYTNSGTYAVQLIASTSLCHDTAQVTVFIEDQAQYTLPNVFTPNGDLKNDIFTINGSGMENFNGKIFNRWGTELYEWNDPKGGWNGENQPAGVYYYTIGFNSNSGALKSITGFVNLLR